MLSAEQVEVLGGCGGLDHLPVDVVPVRPGLPAVTELEEPLQPGRGVLRARPVHAVGQQESETWQERERVGEKG